MSRIAKHTRALIVVGIAFFVAAAVVMVAGSALASTAKPTQFSLNTKVNPGVLAQGRMVTSHVKVTNPEQKVKSWWSASAISTVVRHGVNGKYQMPYRSNGFRCTPVVQGKTTRFTCILVGADVPTTVKLTFTINYKNA